MTGEAASSVSPADPIDAPGEDRDPRAPVGPLPATAQVTCPQCDRIFKNANGLSIHVGKAHLTDKTNGHAEPVNVDPEIEAKVAAHPDEPSLRQFLTEDKAKNGVDKDPREIHENCPGCGQLFTWQPAFITHKRTCRGRPESAAIA